MKIKTPNELGVETLFLPRHCATTLKSWHASILSHKSFVLFAKRFFPMMFLLVRDVHSHFVHPRIAYREGTGTVLSLEIERRQLFLVYPV